MKTLKQFKVILFLRKLIVYDFRYIWLKFSQWYGEEEKFWIVLHYCAIFLKSLWLKNIKENVFKQFSFVLFCLSLAWLWLIIAFVKNTAGVGDVTMLGMYYVSKDPRDCLVCPPANPPPFKLVFLSPFHSLLTTIISTASSSRLWS